MSPPTTKPVGLVLGASRGIGRQIALSLAASGYSVVVAAKSSSSPPSSTNNPSPFPPDPNSPLSTITTVAREIHLAGGDATAIPVDTTSFPSIQRLITQTIAKYHRLDVLVYSPGAIWWASVEDTPMKRYHLMQRVNSEGLYGTVQCALPYLKRSERGGRIVVVSPPIYSRVFRGKTAYAMTKVAMSVLVKGLAMDFEREGRGDMAVMGVWPAVVGISLEIACWVGDVDVCDSLSHPLLRSSSRRKIHHSSKTFGNRKFSRTRFLRCYRPQRMW
jgi:NAD(P)-dependent dehydrogenase (short-subunit alcohol dehydrogenase family)